MKYTVSYFITQQCTLYSDRTYTFKIDEEDTGIIQRPKSALTQKCRDMARIRLMNKRSRLADSPGMNFNADRPQTGKKNQFSSKK